MKILHTADWHIGDFKGPEQDGMNMRALDTIRCLHEMCTAAEEQHPDLVLVSGDIFHRAEVWQGRSHTEVLQAWNIIKNLSHSAGKVIVMRGTPNHDSAEAFEELQAHFESSPNVCVVVTPQVISTTDADIAVLPGFDRGVFRAKFPGLGKEEENEVFTKELGNIITGLRAQCNETKPKILMAHYTVPGSNTESGQEMQLTQFEPILPVDALIASGYDLICLGHIHRPQKVETVPNCYYSGAINALNFNDEGQERGFWIHNTSNDTHTFIKTPYRQFITYQLTDTDITGINNGHLDEIAYNWWGYNSSAKDKIVRIRYSCSYEHNKALNKVDLERRLISDGAFYVSEIVPDKISEFADRNDMDGNTDPEENLKTYLENQYSYSPQYIEKLIVTARPIIYKAEANISLSTNTGIFEPVSIEVRNYRNYEEERFDFSDISFCTINGNNGAGKSSLFMDAIIDCLFEEPREGDLTGWIRKDDSARSASIMFTFRIGQKIYRVTRTRARSGKATLNLAEFVDNEWQDRSCEKFKDTQDEINKVLGMDSMTMKACAMIMQDQYGLFLEAKKEDRMAILGTLLGLGIYDEMENISADTARQLGGKLRSTKQEIEIKQQSVFNLGDPQRDIDDKQIILDNLQSQKDEKEKIINQHKVTLSMYDEAQKHISSLKSDISGLKLKTDVANESILSYNNLVNDAQTVLDQKIIIESKINQLTELEEQEKTLSEKSAIYSQLKSAKADLVKQEAEETQNIEDLCKKERSAVEEKQSYEMPDDEGHIRAQAAEYDRYNRDFKEMLEKQVAHNLATNTYKDKCHLVESQKMNISKITSNLDMEKSGLLRRTELLENSGCIDSEHAECRFLADAIDAKKQLASFDDRYKILEKENQYLHELEIKADDAKNNISASGYDEITLNMIKRQLELLKGAPEALKQMEERKAHISLIQSKIDSIEENIEQASQRADTVKAKISEIDVELEQNKDAYDKRNEIILKIYELKPWREKEKELPLAEERKQNAVKRISELSADIADMKRQIADKETDLNSCIVADSGIDSIRDLVRTLDNEVLRISKEIAELNMDLGAARQKQEQANQLKAEIAELEKTKNMLSGETAEYDILKSAFSQDGIPHQIIRAIIPKLTLTANSILGQMSGGKMGIEFQTERVMKSNSSKEVVALDILIDEYGKSILPYLSKSGGEKVKASLSVILALSEIKSSSVGVQMGMLFIDEPPFLDADGIQAYCDALEAIRNRYENMKIMAITHDPTMKARFPQSIDIVKTEHGSKVVYL